MIDERMQNLKTFSCTNPPCPMAFELGIMAGRMPVIPMGRKKMNTNRG